MEYPRFVQFSAAICRISQWIQFGNNREGSILTSRIDLSLTELRRSPEVWGRLVESAVGAHLLNTSLGTPIEVNYRRERNLEVDCVV